MSTNFELFPGKDLSGLFKDIYDNQQQKKKRISELIAEMRKIIRHAGDMVVIGPIIKDLVDSSVRNDDSLAEYNSFFQLIIYKGDSVYFETGIFRNKSTEWSKIIIKTQILESFENLKLKIRYWHLCAGV